MSAAKLLADLTRLGIRLEPHGDRLRYHPRWAVTPDLAARLKTHKGELLAILRPKAEAPGGKLPDATATWHAALDRLEDNPLFPTHVMEVLRAATVGWVHDPEADHAGDQVGYSRERFEERAAIIEYEGGLSRERAEALALAEIIGQME